MPEWLFRQLPDTGEFTMNLDERITALEQIVAAQNHQLRAIETALTALAGESDHRFRLGLFEDLAERISATLLTLPIKDAHLDRALQDFESTVARLRGGFLRAYTRADAREPPQRPADGITRVEMPRRP